jgi:uncharacterized protein YhaN
MRLVRIEARRFGKIDGRTLGDLSPGLTVVHGPNEAGKSSLMALVRHVLYGFPTPADTKEAPYISEAGAREGRLVFADEGGEWVVERREGVHGGPVTVRTLSGCPRDGLLGELTSGVSRLAYRVVFGFGLSEMQQIEELKGKDDDLLARLYAAGAGLVVSPIDVRAKLQASMDALWAKRASAPVLNRAKARRDEVRGEVRALESAADSLRADASRLEELERDLESARVRRTETQLRAETVARATAEAERLMSDAEEESRRADGLAREAAAARFDAAGVVADGPALAAAESVDAVAADLSGFRQQLVAITAQRSGLEAVEARLRTAVADTGWPLEAALVAASDAGIPSEIEAFRAGLDKARARVDVAMGVRDAARAEGAGAGGSARPWLVPGLLVAAIGVAGAAAGLASSQGSLVVFGIALVVVGGGLALAGRRPVPGSDARPVSRAAAAESGLAAAEQSLAAALESWGAWVRSRGLGDGGEDPAAVAARCHAARAARAADEERAATAVALERAQDAANDYARRVRDATSPLSGDAGDVALDRVPEVVGSACSRVAAALEAAGAGAEAAGRAESLGGAEAESRARAAEAAARAQKALEAIATPAPGIERARAALIESRDGASWASDEFDRLSQEATALRTALGTERRENALAEFRLEEETLGEQIAEGVREYAVLALAARLLELARERYERDRQPEVVKRAEAAFASMTNGRYARIAVPLGKDAIEVFDTASAATSPGRLSRGTAEQLYLALRLGLIEQLGDVGRGLPVLMDDILVDFSPERLEPAARAIADLATRRQVVFLTCHPATADLLCAVSAGAVRLEIDGP